MRVFKLILEILFWCVAAAGSMLLAAVVVGFVFKPVLGYFAAIAVVGLLPLILRTVRVVRMRRAATLMSYLDQCVRLNLPLTVMLDAAMASERGALALEILKVRTLLAEGAPLGAALDAAAPDVPHREVSIIAAAEQVGRLPGGIDRVLRERQRELRRSALEDQVFFRAYPLIMVVMISTVIAVTAVFVLPKFEQIFKDFGVKLPAITVATFDAAQWIGPPMLFVVITGVMYASAVSLWQVFHPTRATATLRRQVRDRLFWFMPVLHGLERDRGLADVFDLLADAFAVGTPADRAMGTAAGIGVNAVLADRLRQWSLALAGGASLADGARQARMPALVVGMLANVSATASAADVFDFLARYYRTRFSRIAAVLDAAMVPLVTLCFALLVTCVALAMFMPLITLIQNMSGGTSGKWRI